MVVVVHIVVLATRHPFSLQGTAGFSVQGEVQHRIAISARVAYLRSCAALGIYVTRESTQLYRILGTLTTYMLRLYPLARWVLRSCP